MTRGPDLQWSLLQGLPLTSVAPAVIHRLDDGIPRQPLDSSTPGGAMSPHEVPDVPVWSAVLDELTDDERVTPQLQGFLNLAVPQGVMGGTLYLDVPNDLTAAQFTKRMRAPIMEALSRVEQESQVSATTFRVVVTGIPQDETVQAEFARQAEGVGLRIAPDLLATHVKGLPRAPRGLLRAPGRQVGLSQ